MSAITVRHYLWAGLDFMFDADGTPVLLEANRSSHMLGEYMHFHGDERPFALVAAEMNRTAGVPCLLWRSSDPEPDADEDACFIGHYLARHLDRPPVICNVENNQEPRTELISREGQHVRPGSIFRWWYGLPWSFERSGVHVINPNSLWVAARDKLACYRLLRSATHFRVPLSFAVEHVDEAQRLLSEHAPLFAKGFVLKPRVGWGGFGVQVGSPGDALRPFPPGYLLSERILPPLRHGRFWDVRAFVMAGVYLGGVQYSSGSPITNYFQGGQPERLDDATSNRLEAAALEAVALIDAEAERIHRLPDVPDSPLIQVVY